MQAAKWLMVTGNHDGKPSAGAAKLLLAVDTNHYQQALPFFTGTYYLGLHTSSRRAGNIACLGLGSRWSPNGRPLGQLLDDLPHVGLYRYQRSQATRAAASPPPPPDRKSVV